MHISCSQEDLVRGFANAKPAASSKSALPVLTHILLDAREGVDEGRVRIAATNLDLVIAGLIPAQVDRRGAIAVPSRIVTDFVGTLPEGQLELTLNAQTQTLRIQSGRMSANVKGIDANEFPVMPTFPPASIQVELEAKGLREMFDRVIFAAAIEDSRPVLTGMLAKFDEKQLALGAADGFRLSVQHTGIGESVEPFSLIIRVKAMQEVGRLCTDQVQPGILSVSPNKTQVRFALTKVEVISQLIEGAYPDLTLVIPQSHTSRAVMNVSELLTAAKMVTAFLLSIHPFRRAGRRQTPFCAYCADSLAAFVRRHAGARGRVPACGLRSLAGRMFGQVDRDRSFAPGRTPYRQCVQGDGGSSGDHPR